VGVTLTPGEILDPVNDLVERFSWIMLAATISLGVQQVLLDVGQWWGLRALVALLGLLWLWVRLRRATISGEAGPAGNASAVETTLFQVFIVVLFVRFAVPVAVIANEALYHLFLQSRYQQSQQVIESAGADLEQATLPARDAEAEAGAEAPGLIESLGRSLSGTREALDFRQRLDTMRQRASEVIAHLIQLSVVFVLQTAILPLAFLWIFLQLARQIFRQKFQRRD
jgi:hypothetical protein